MMQPNRNTLWLAGAIVLGGVTLMAGAFWRHRQSSNGKDSTVGQSAKPSASLQATDDSPQTAESSLALPESERSYIWQIEHFVLVLDFRFWPGLSAAIRDLDRERVRSFFKPGVKAALINQESVQTESLDIVQIRSATATEFGTHAVPLDELIGYWLERAGDFDSGRRVSIKTVFLSPDQRDQVHGPWHGRLVMRIWGQSTDGRPTEFILEADLRFAALADDVPSPAAWIESCQSVQESFRQSEKFLMAEVGESWGLDRSRFHDNWLNPTGTPLVMTGGVYATDYDLDGKTDLLITDKKGNVLYRQTAPGKFEDATWVAGLDVLPPGAAVAWADLDGDAYPDLIFENELLRNTGRGSFVRAGALKLLHTNRIHGYAIADYDRDGMLDIYVARLAPDPLEGEGKTAWLDDRSGPGNTLLRNLGDWKFQDVTAASGTSAGTVSCLSAAWLDANGDLWPDLFAGDEFGSPVLLVNRGDGTFESRTVTGDFGGFNMGVATGDLDDDGRTDLYLANMYSKAGERVLSNLNLDLYPPDLARRIRHIVDGSELWHNLGDLNFESKGRASGVARVGWSYGPRVADFDNDGRLDIYSPAGFYSVSRDEPDG